jgi:hypothetical protein
MAQKNLLVAFTIIACIAIFILIAMGEGKLSLGSSAFGVSGLCWLVVVLYLLYLLVRVPSLQAEGVMTNTPDEHFNAENEARRTMMQLVAGALILGGFYYNWKTLENARVATQTTTEVNQAQLRVTGDAQRTDQFTRAVGQLGEPDKNLALRVGGIYGLEHVAQTALRAYESSVATKDSRSTQDYQRQYFSVIAVLCAYVQTNFPCLPKSRSCQPPRESYLAPADMQAALRVIGHLNRTINEAPSGQFPDLGFTNLSGAYLRTADLKNMALDNVSLRNAVFGETSLHNAWVYDSDLSNADLDDTDFGEADLTRTNLSGSKMADVVGLTVDQALDACGDQITELPKTWSKDDKVKVLQAWKVASIHAPCSQWSIQRGVNHSKARRGSTSLH